MKDTTINSGGLVEVDSKQILGGLVKKYQETGEEKYFEQLWELVKPFGIMIARKYPSIPFEEREPLAMHCLWDCCKTFKEGKNLLTLYGTVLGNRMYDFWGKKMQTQKYKINSEAASLDKLKEDVNFQPAAEVDNFNIELFYYECKLIGIELKIVALINEGYRKTEILKKLKLKSEEYNELLEIIKEKVRNNYLSEEFIRI